MALQKWSFLERTVPANGVDTFTTEDLNGLYAIRCQIVTDGLTLPLTATADVTIRDDESSEVLLNLTSIENRKVYFLGPDGHDISGSPLTKSAYIREHWQTNSGLRVRVNAGTGNGGQKYNMYIWFGSLDNRRDY